MKKRGFRTIKIESKWSSQGYIVDWDEENFVKELIEALEDGMEPFQVLAVGKDFVLFLRK